MTVGKLAYFTILRNPLDRYISEWLQVRLGGSWQKSTLRYRGKAPTATQYRLCPYSAIKNNSNLSLITFANCPKALSNNRQTRMIASLNQLGRYSYLHEWTRPSNSSSHLEKLTPLQIDLLASAVENLATAFVTFGLVEHMTYTKYMYRRQVGLVFRNSFANLTNSSWDRLSISRSNFLPSGYETLVAARNRIDEIFLDAAKTLFANRSAIRLKSDSILPRTLRFHIRHLLLQSLLNEHDLEIKINRFLYHFFKLEIKTNKSARFLSNYLYILLIIFCFQILALFQSY